MMPDLRQVPTWKWLMTPIFHGHRDGLAMHLQQFINNSPKPYLLMGYMELDKKGKPVHSLRSDSDESGQIGQCTFATT